MKKQNKSKLELGNFTDKSSLRHAFMYLDLAVGKWPNGTPSRDHYSSFDLKKTISSNLVFFSQLRDKFVNIRSKLSELSNCQAIILGNQYDLQYVTEILHAIDRRLELWKYCDASSHTIREWLQTVFKKVIIQVLNSDSSYRHTVYLDRHM